MLRDSPPPAHYQPPTERRPGKNELVDETEWKDADHYFHDNPRELTRRMFQWAKKDDRKAARNILSHWLRSEHPELRCAGNAALETWLECFYSEPAYREAYQEWKRWFAAHRRKMDYE